MTSRTRVRNCLARKPIDRLPRCDSFWEDTLTAWRTQGLPADVSPDDHFDWDIRMMYLDCSPRCEQKMLSEDQEFVVFQDRAGYTARKMVGKSRALAWLDHVTKDRATWRKLKAGFALNPVAPARLNAKSYFGHFDEYPSWPEAKRLFDRLRETDRYQLFTVYGPWEGTFERHGWVQ